MEVFFKNQLFKGLKSIWSSDEQNDDVLVDFQKFLDKNKNEHILCFFSYDLKNNIEKLTSKNSDAIKFPQIICFVPKEISNSDLIKSETVEGERIHFIPKITKEKYLENIVKIKNHIQKGDFYEANYCYEWAAKTEVKNPKTIYNKLKKITEAPYGFYADLENYNIMSASPELYIKKRGNKIYSSPIKGTQKKDEDPKKDKLLKKQLENSLKDQAENNMIVDLVRNDLSRIAKKSTVKVEELRKVYSFKNIHQMISTVSCEVSENITVSEILKATFPIGSMTGAPKIRVMQCMEEYEQSKRGLYSGSFGLIYPNGDFDFNVIIRTLIYNKSNHLLSFHVGGAITNNSSPELEYEETLIKADALFKACQQ